jgi:hypothetical protein
LLLLRGQRRCAAVAAAAAAASGGAEQVARRVHFIKRCFTKNKQGQLIILFLTPQFS